MSFSFTTQCIAQNDAIFVFDASTYHAGVSWLLPYLESFITVIATIQHEDQIQGEL
jgi:hypothetical protein